MSSSSLIKETSKGSASVGTSDEYKDVKKLRGSYNIMNTTTNEEGTSDGNPFDANFSNFDDDYTRRENTNEFEEDELEGGEDGDIREDELPMAEKIDTIKPVVDHQDRLWKQIDILDDVKKMSNDISKNGTFFDANHSKALDALRDSQMQLLVNMKNAEKLIDESLYHEIWDLNIDETAEDEIDLIKAKLFDKEQFTKISGSIDEIKSGLDDLKKKIKIVDENAKDMWDNNDFSVAE